jgi:hypothetical protein
MLVSPFTHVKLFISTTSDLKIPSIPFELLPDLVTHLVLSSHLRGVHLLPRSSFLLRVFDIVFSCEGIVRYPSLPERSVFRSASVDVERRPFMLHVTHCSVIPPFMI